MSLPVIFSLKLNPDRRAGKVEDDADGSFACLSHTFWLDPLDVCVRYRLCIEKVPCITALYVNSQYVCTIENHNPILIDITDVVALEDNVIMFQFDRFVSDLGEEFGNIQLEAVPCE